MSNVPYSVSVVLDRCYGSRLRELLKAGPVWAVESPANRDCAQQLWEEFPGHDHLDGITVFKSAEDRSPEQMLLDEMEAIDLHHGAYSANPPYTVIRIVGCGLNPEVKEELEKFGFDSFTPISEGFEATRPMPPPVGN